jgi:hypothetical protein
MPRDGSMTPRDLVGKLYVLRAECDKCGRRGRYSLRSVVEKIGMDGNWLLASRMGFPVRIATLPVGLRRQRRYGIRSFAILCDLPAHELAVDRRER